MKLIHLILIFWTATFASNVAMAQEAPIAEVELLSSVDKLPPGTPAKFALKVTVHKPWHLNANPASEPFLIPTEVFFEDSADVVIEQISYPPGESFTFEFSESAIDVYSGVIYITAVATAPGRLAGKELTISGMLTYQACNDEYCLPPKDISFQQVLGVARDPAEVTPTHEAIFGRK